MGLEASVDWIAQQGIEKVRQHEHDLTRQLLAGLAEISTIRLLGPLDAERKVGVTSFVVEGFDAADLSAILDDSFGIAVRSGLHCAPGAHRALGTLESGGTVRVSTGPFHTPGDVDQLLAALRAVSGG